VDSPRHLHFVAQSSVACFLLGSIVLLAARQNTYAFIDHPKVGDEFEMTHAARYFVQGKSGVDYLTERRVVLGTDASGETVRISSPDFSQGSKNGAAITMHLDLFLHYAKKFTGRNAISTDRVDRAEWFYPPAPRDFVLKPGRKWTRLITQNLPPEIPPGRYEATFVGYEKVHGLRCAKVVSSYRELSKERLGIRQTSWFYSGLQYVKRMLRVENVEVKEGPVVLETTSMLTFWKFGPPPLNRSQR
jgi:hypothetical protein